MGTVRTRGGGGRRHDPESTLPESPPGTEGGSVRVNTAATAANTATPPRRPPERRGPARAAHPPAGPPPSPWRPMGQRGPRKEDTAGPRTRDSRVSPGRRASAARGGFRVGPGVRDRTFCAGAGGRKCGVSLEPGPGSLLAPYRAPGFTEL